MSKCQNLKVLGVTSKSFSVNEIPFKMAFLRETALTLQ